MKPKMYELLRMCVENGVTLGVNRAFKHTDTPNVEHIISSVDTALMNEIHDWFEFDKIQ